MRCKEIASTTDVEKYREKKTSGDMAVKTNQNTDEENWQLALRNLQRLKEQYEEAKARDDGESQNLLAGKIVEAMRRLSEIHTDPGVCGHWKDRAEAFAKADSNARDHILTDIGKGLLILLATPFALVGAVLFAAGGIIYGVGSVVKGLGNLLTGGMLGRW